MTSTYLALTIGPVFKTMKMARKTRELWAASALFSALMKHLIAHLDPDGSRTLIPRVPASVAMMPLYGAGLYPDRLFLEANDLTEKDVETAIEQSLHALTKDCLRNPTDAQIKDASLFWKDFFRIRYVHVPVDKLTNLITHAAPYLDTLELEAVGHADSPSSDALLEWFRVENLYKSEIGKKLHGEARGTYNSIISEYAFFPATMELALYELLKNPTFPRLYDTEKKQIEPEEIFENLEKGSAFSKQLHPRHRYYCIVQADGDNFGTALEKLGTKEAYIDFSEKLSVFAAKSAGIINDFGGKPIYIGGDDLLFLAPVYNGEQTVFDLITELDEAMHATGLGLTVSYAVQMVYYKYPLFEAIHSSYSLLEKAKGHKNKQGKTKNSVAFNLLKHSGGAFHGVLSKELLRSALATMNQFAQHQVGNRSGVVSSLIFKIRSMEGLLNALAKQVADTANPEQALRERLTSFFDAFFNEWKDAAFDAQRKATLDLLLQIYAETPQVTEDANAGKPWLKLFYDVMRLIDFMFSPKESNADDTQNHPTAN